MREQVERRPVRVPTISHKQAPNSPVPRCRLRLKCAGEEQGLRFATLRLGGVGQPMLVCPACLAEHNRRQAAAKAAEEAAG